jgi:ribosomal protein S10
MLISKNFMHVLYFLKKQKKILFILFSYAFKQKILFYLAYLLNIKFFLKNMYKPSFFFYFKISVLNKFFFNQVLFKIFDYIKGINVKIISNVSCVKKKKSVYTVLRSPFVHKKSKEQFVIEKFNGFFILCLKNQTNFFFIDFIEIF